MLAANSGLLLTMFFWGLQLPIIDILLQRFDPYFVAALRYDVAVPFFLILLVWREGLPLIPKEISYLRLITVSLGMAGFGVLFALGVQHANPINAAIMGAMGPLISAVVAWFFIRQPLAGYLWISIIFAIAGGILAGFKGTENSWEWDFKGGELLIILAMACWSWYSLAAQQWLQGYSQLRITAITMLPCGIMLTVLYGILGVVEVAALPPSPTWTELYLFATITFGSVMLGVFLWNYGVQQLGIMIASLFLNLIPVFAVLITMAFGHYPTFAQWLGGILVIISVIYGQTGRFWQKRV